MKAFGNLIARKSPELMRRIEGVPKTTKSVTPKFQQSLAHERSRNDMATDVPYDVPPGCGGTYPLVVVVAFIAAGTQLNY